MHNTTAISLPFINRTVPDSEEKLCRDLEWAGIEWDEGPDIAGPYGPYKQSHRTKLYTQHAATLLDSGNAYRCFCSSERLRILAEHRNRLGLPPDYDRSCAHIPREESDDRAAKGESHVVRLKVPDEYPHFKDIVYGHVRQRKSFAPRTQIHESYEDPILLKSDGFPTYHLANVVDDHLMKITLVIRGSEWISSTPKHLAMYQAFGWQPPEFAHVGLLTNKDHQKLSKRDGALNISAYRDDLGIFPETLVNFLALHGWSHQGRTDVMGMEDLIRNASLRFTRGDTIVGFDKLNFLQKRHAARYASLPQDNTLSPAHDLMELAVSHILKQLEKIEFQSEKAALYRAMPDVQSRKFFIYSIVLADASNYSNPAEFITRSHYFFHAPSPEKLLAEMPSLKLRNIPSGSQHEISERLIQFTDNFAEISDVHWKTSNIKSWINSIVDQGSLSTILRPHLVGESTEKLEELATKAWSKAVHQYLRWAISAGMPGPDGAVTMSILGREESLRRLKMAKEVIMRRGKGDGLIVQIDTTQNKT
ncbi:hypothetical protein B7494_g1441 [Chlorociboria aeruginascens]|nr:hypothetical protein B7494_g1441 [Chlorociboria aeruginascens]